MRKSTVTREQAFDLLKTYNKDPFHIRHALTVEGIMRYYAEALGFADEKDYWGIVGLLHDIDFELYPDEHCKKAPALLAAGGVGEDMIRAICSHGYGICCDVEPTEQMEKFSSPLTSSRVSSAPLPKCVPAKASAIWRFPA